MTNASIDEIICEAHSMILGKAIRLALDISDEVPDGDIVARIQEGYINIKIEESENFTMIINDSNLIAVIPTEYHIKMMIKELGEDFLDSFDVGLYRQPVVMCVIGQGLQVGDAV